ncbi:MAG: hypothetical protein JXA79_01180 [Deltaproteobacteria bacterium]|nr:hypothetical protein [Deltaproteobacteria bacterium]
MGRILGVEVIAPKESSKVHARYKAKGWLKEMEVQLGAVGATVKDFQDIDPRTFAVVRYRPASLELLDTPLEFAADDPAVAANYYILLNQKQKPKLIKGLGEFAFTAGHNKKKSSTKKKHYEIQSAKLDLIHNQIQDRIYHQLVEHYGENNVGTELDTGNGSQIDIVVRDKDKNFIFFEIKTSYSLRLSIREALGQLLEYAFFPKATDPKKLVIVSPNKVTDEARVYLKDIRKRFGLPIFYRQYEPETEALQEAEY